MSPRSFPRDKSLIALGKAVRAIRLEKELTQEQLAARAEVHVTYISVIELGRRNVSWVAVRKISQALDVTLPELVGRAEDLERKI